jgi:sugar transferase (PEP-CTERM/EpsH1 system associated)
MKILVITDAIPYPPVSGAQVRMYNLLRRVAERHEVWLAALLFDERETEGIPHLQTFCAGVETVLYERKSRIAHLPGLVRYAISGTPLEIKFYFVEEMAEKIERLASSVSFDIVQIAHSHMATYLERLPPGSYHKSVLEFIDAGFAQYTRISRIERGLGKRARRWLYGQMMRRWEPKYAERFDHCLSVSEVDQTLLQGANPNLRFNVIPNGVDTQALQPLPRAASAPSLLFVGTMRYSPCADAVLYFCNEILPLIRESLGEVEMWIVGIDPPPEVRALDGDGVHVTGRVESVVPYYQRADVAVVPLRAGGGTRLKILEAMALGRPVVSTTIGREGLDVTDGEHLLVADDPAAFADHAIRLLRDSDLYHMMTDRARHLVVSRYDWDAIADQLLDVYDRLCSG